MKNNFLGRNLFWFLFLSMVLAWSACRKKEYHGPDQGLGQTGMYSVEDSLKFYVWWINESDSANIPLYYWYDQVPDINPFSSQYQTADDLLESMKSYTSEAGIKPVDRYSFLDRAGTVSGEIEGGQLGDKGFDVNWAGVENSDDTYLYVIWAYANSPAGEAGVQRGWQITAVNGNSNVAYDGPGYGNESEDNLNRVLKAVLTAPSAAFTFARPDKPDTTITLSVDQYKFNPILFDTTYTVDGKQVGYVVFNSFVSVYNYSYDDNGNLVTTPTDAKTQIDKVFKGFQDKGIKDLIVDLRYNGGGAVNTAEYLDDLIAPAGQTGQTMYTAKFNDPLGDYYEATDQNPPVLFQKKGGLDLDHVFFIVSHGTVSASELTINNLKPVMDVKLIGTPTYGKPVGFIPLPIYIVNDTTRQEEHVADMYAINFQTFNQNGKGDYFKGMTPDQWNNDFVDINWGDMRDSCLLEALGYIKTNNWVRASSNARLRNGAGLRRASIGMKKEVVGRRFNGMVDSRLTKFKRGMRPFKKN